MINRTPKDRVILNVCEESVCIFTAWILVGYYLRSYPQPLIPGELVLYTTTLWAISIT